MNLYSPAKINLFLHIKGKRRDGYHELASLLQAVSLFDEVDLKLADVDSFTCSLPSLQNGSNLVLKARDLFRKKTGLSQPLSISLKKNIPDKAGLGGGSGNAATTLWGMNALFGSPVSEEMLQTWSKDLGSDVPFFFSLGSAFCTGRGECVENVASLPPQELSIIKPQVSLSTQDVYSQITQITPKNSEKTLQQFLSGAFCYENDLEPAAFLLCPELKSLKDRLLLQSSCVLLSGSGSSFFCVGKRINPSLLATFITRQPGKWYENISSKIDEKEAKCRYGFV